jgi:hypothetical protein
MKMRIPGMFVAVAVAVLVSTAAHAAEYLYLNASTNKKWRADLLAFLQQKKPTADGVSIAITPAGDVHVYVVPGAFAGIYSIERLHRHPTDHPSPAVRAIIDGGTGRMIGFVPTDKTEKAEGEQRGARFDVFMLTWTKPTS